MRLEISERTLSVYFDFRRNLYDSLTPGGRSANTRMNIQSMTAFFRRTATARVRRHMKLPTVMIHADEGEFVSLLREAREAYIDGHYFSAIASAVTAADIVCMRLADRYAVDKVFRRKLARMTFGQKLAPLRAVKVLSPDQEAVLIKMNRIRNRTLHPKGRLGDLVLKRDALKAVLLLHEVLEGTFSVFRDYTFDGGRLVPRPLT